MMRLPPWKRWNTDVTSRALRLLVIAALLALGAAANTTSPAVQLALEMSRADYDPIGSFVTARADSIKEMIARPPAPVRLRSSNVNAVASRKTYRRSSVMELAMADLRKRELLIPVAGVTTNELYDSFDQARDNGSRRHRAIDIFAPRGTPILSIDDGSVIKLHTSRSGGISVYATDSSERFIYFYAHLDSYHPNLREGMRLTRGDTLGFVGTTGNAPPNTPHLHFAILRASNLARWSSGTPINPVKVLK
jgi:murein DD-endopeptidase MepM/ murein hydrolase activator NlpD